MFINQDNPPEEENNQNNQNEVKAWNNNQTIYDISLITTNQNNNLDPAPTDINANQIYLVINSTHGHHTANFLDEFQNGYNPSLTNKEDKIELIEKAPVVNQNRSLVRNKRFRGSKKNHNRGLINNANQEKGFSNYTGQLENNSTLRHSSYRLKRRKKKLNNASNSNIDQKKFRYKIKKIKKYH